MATTPVLERPTGLRALFEAADDRRPVTRRAYLHRSGDPLRHSFLVVSGWIGRFRAGASGTEAVTGVYVAGDVGGLDALSGGRWQDDLIALSDAVVLRLPLEEVRAAMARGGPAAPEVAGLLAAEAGFLREALFAVGTLSSRERLATFILQTFERLLAAGLVEPDDKRFALPLTQAQLAAVAGLTSVHVNRVLKLLRTTGVLEWRGGSVHIMDLAGLRRAAQRRA